MHENGRPDTQVSIVVPCYRSEQMLPKLVAELRNALQPWAGEYEIVLVEDCSRDRTWDVIADLQRQFPGEIVAVQLMRNFGQHNALMCGFRHARGRVIVTIDDDLQNPPTEIPKLLKVIEETQADLVYGVASRRQHAFHRILGARLANALFRAIFQSSVSATSFRAIRRELVLSIVGYNLNFTFLDGLLAWNTQRIGEVVVEHRPRRAGTSGYSFGRLFTLLFNVLTNFSVFPLQIASIVGLMAAFAGLIAAAYYLVLALSSKIDLPGYASVIVAVLTLGGLQLLALGVIGEYIGRLHLNINRKPQFSVRQVLSETPNEGDSKPQ